MISIIIPIYNTEKYLDRCILSILKQGLSTPDYEVILVNDGSTDNSDVICKKYTKQHPDIFRYIEKKNEGVSSARNLGVQHAAGDYVYFLDPDDFLADLGLSTILLKYDISQFDILYFKSIAFYENEPLNKLNEPIFGKLEYTGDGINLLRKGKRNYECWNMIINKKFLINNHIQFQNIFLAEDILFNIDCLMNTKSLCIVSDNIYRYCIRKHSAVTNRNRHKMKKAGECYEVLFGRINQIINKYPHDKGLTESLREIFRSQFQPYFTRFLSACYNYNDFYIVKNNINKNAVYCSRPALQKLAQFSTRNYCTYCITSYLFNYLFMPMVYPFINKK